MNAVIFGTGEYVTGWTGAEGSKSDKSLGVVALVHFDLRDRGLIGDKIALCGTNGNKFEAIRNHFKEKIVFSNLPNLDFEQFPQTGEVIFLKRRLQFQLKKISYLWTAFADFKNRADISRWTQKPTWTHWTNLPSLGISALCLHQMILISRSFLRVRVFVSFLLPLLASSALLSLWDHFCRWKFWWVRMWRN